MTETIVTIVLLVVGLFIYMKFVKGKKPDKSDYLTMTNDDIDELNGEAEDADSDSDDEPETSSDADNSDSAND